LDARPSITRFNFLYLSFKTANFSFLANVLAAVFVTGTSLLKASAVLFTSQGVFNYLRP
jgi:hypothetical protein